MHPRHLRKNPQYSIQHRGSLNRIRGANDALNESIEPGNEKYNGAMTGLMLLLLLLLIMVSSFFSNPVQRI